jgi:hypothetical protein
MHIGLKPTGTKMKVYNLVGELVFDMTLKGDWAYDTWDGLNNNGILVATGVYFALFDGDSRVYKFSVLRDN